MIKSTIQLMNFLSIWELGLRWADCDIESNNISNTAKEKLRDILHASERTLNLYNVNGEKELDKFIPIINIEIPNKIQRRAIELARKREYPKEELNNIFISKDEFFKWALIFDVPLPSFWYSEDEINYYYVRRKFYYDDKPHYEQSIHVHSKKPTASQEDKQLAQTIAKQCWEESPDTNIKDMTQHEAVQIQGNGKLYTYKTLRKWLSEVAPSHIKGKPGRPPKAK